LLGEGSASADTDHDGRESETEQDRDGGELGAGGAARACELRGGCGWSGRRVDGTVWRGRDARARSERRYGRVPLSDSIYTELCKKASDRPRRDLREVMELECDEEAEQTVSEHYRPTARREQTGGWALIRHEPVTGREWSTAVGTSDRGSHRRGWRTEPEG
jgi:hypothetical protein